MCTDSFDTNVLRVKDEGRNRLLSLVWIQKEHGTDIWLSNISSVISIIRVNSFELSIPNFFIK